MQLCIERMIGLYRFVGMNLYQEQVTGLEKDYTKRDFLSGSPVVLLLSMYPNQLL